jgi:ATP-dependent Clp protease ATP-binding subunit ClpC
MFDPFTPEVEEALSLSRWEADRYRTNEIGPEHLLLAMIQVSGLAARVLQGLKIDEKTLRAEIERLGDPEKAPWKGRTPARFPLTDRSRRVLGMALKCAQILHHRAVTDGHILLALLQAREGVAYQALKNLASKPDAVRDAVLKNLGAAQDGSAGGATKGDIERMRKALDENLPRG